MVLFRQVIIVSASLSVAAGAASPAGAQTQQQIDWRVGKGNTFSPDLRISGCTAAIQSGRWSGKGLVYAIARPERTVARAPQTIPAARRPRNGRPFPSRSNG